MIVIVCLDDNGGMMFNKRRQSRDRKVTEEVQRMCTGKRLWMNGYSANLYGDTDGVDVRTDKDFLRNAGVDDYCFVESEPLEPVLDKISKLIVFRWNRKYPSDLRLDLDLGQWDVELEEEFPGKSHDKIIKTVYIKKEET